MASVNTATADVPFCFDEERQLSKMERSRRGCRRDNSGDFPAPSMKSSSSSAQHRRCSFTRKCARLVREQRARFYIMRRCIAMLICWRDYGDS